jgi:L-ascorbate metabolism protein UlaG (beta-lactamase superfamily)
MTPPTPPSPGAITWLGHATVLIELDGARLLTDPLLGARVGPLVRIAAPVAMDQVSGLDAVLLSHLHADHTHVGSLRALGATPRIVAPRGAADWLRRQGLAAVSELSAGQRTHVGPVTVTATAAVHEGRRRPLGPEAEAVGYLVQGTRSVYFAGDTDLFEAMGELRGQVDVALLPVWGWGSTLGPGHLDPERAARATRVIAPAIAIPIHWGTMAMSRPAPRAADPERPAREFAELAGRYAPDTEVRGLTPGQGITL